MTTEIALLPMLEMISGPDIQGPPDFLIDFIVGILQISLGLVIWVGSILLSCFWIHFLFTLPMRRAERARLFLDLLEDALNRGQSIEAMMLSLAQSHDRTVGIRFHWLAAHIENGLRFDEALDKVPHFLPPQIIAMLHAGQKLGDLRRVLPACRETLRDHPAGVRSAVHYLMLVAFFFSPAFFVVLILTSVFVIPKFKDIAAGMGVQLRPETIFVFTHTNWFMVYEGIVCLLLAVLTMAYIGGPGFARYFQFRGLPLVDWIAWRVPWKQKRLQRTFSAMLSVLLDGSVPEAEAVRLAGDCTANEICRGRAAQVLAALQRGVKLEGAVHAFDDSGEFRWRLGNAAHARGGFLNALRGWHAHLDARAFQQEEATAHVVTSGLVILNGVLVALIATATFGMLIFFLKAVVGP
jgi:type II secretory pathway component PulF